MANLSRTIRCLGILGLLTTLTVGCATGRGVGDSFVSKKSDERKGKEKDVPSRLNLAYAKVQISEQRYSEARKTYQTVLDKDPKCVEAMLGLARLDLLANRPQEAEKSFQKALKLSPNSPEVLDTVGQYFASVERYPESMELFQKAMEIDPDQKKYRYHYAVALAKSGRVKESMSHFAQSVGPAGAHYNVGRILCDQGNMDGAEEQFMQALLKDPQLREAQEWLDEVRQQKDAKMVRSRGPQNSSTVRANVAPAGATQKGAAKPVVQPTANQSRSSLNTSEVWESTENSVRTTDRIPIPQGAMNPPMTSSAPIPGGNPVSNMGGNPAAATGTTPVGNPPANLNPVQQEQWRNQQMRAQQQPQQSTRPTTTKQQNVWDSL
ncbi:MAG: tetratricopeptide repeat protein [Planctomycetales bacterium]